MLRKLMPWLRTAECWSCYKRLRPSAVLMGYSPFGAPFTYSQCQDCSDHRATDEHHVIWMLRRWGMGAFPPPLDDLERELAWAEADGDPATGLSAVHVVSEGRYVRVREWTGSPAHERALGRYVDHPRHKHLDLDRHARNGNGASHATVP